MTNWTTSDIPVQTGRTAVVTGATGGVGYETALALARAGASIVVAGRNDDKGRAAVSAIKGLSPAADVVYEKLDLASLASIAAFAERIGGRLSAVDILINNAGVMALPKRSTTADGFETQLATNHLGHFALTGRLLPLLRKGKDTRVVTVSSGAHRAAAIDFDDLQEEKGYAPYKAYGQSKLANVLFAFELQRRSAGNGWGIASIGAHPGWARTDIITNGPGQGGGTPIGWRIFGLLAGVLSQSAADGALPSLYAATSRDAEGGGYYGPSGFAEAKGPPKEAVVAPAARDEAVARRLWEASEQLTGVSF